MNLKSTTTRLLLLAALILVVLSLYEIFLKPSGNVASDNVLVIDSYFGEDVLKFLQDKQTPATITPSPSADQL